MYQTGDYIIYGNTGVCEVHDVTTRAADKNAQQLFYLLKPLYSDYTISTPVEGCKVFIRPVITKDEAHALIDTMPKVKAEAYHNRVLRQLSEHYDDLIKTHQCSDLVELTMSIYAKRQYLVSQNRKLGAVDEKFMKKGEELLFGELAVALDIPKQEVKDYITARIGGELDN